MPATASANTYTAHDGASLADAVGKADSNPGPNTIELRAGTYVPSATLTLRGEITIEGPSTAPGVKIDGGGVSPSMSDLFSIVAGARATIANVELTTAGGAGAAAAIEDAGSLDLESSTLAGNNGPAVIVQPGAHATVRNSTLSDGLDTGLIDHGTAKLINATVAANAAIGIDNSDGTLDLVNTIVAGNGRGDCAGRAAPADASLDGDGSCGVGALSRVNPRLGPLSANGGPTPTRALLAGSSAIDAGDNAQCPAEDERHYARADGHCDIGAYEANSQPAPGSSSGGGRGSGSGGSPSHRHRVIGIRGHGTLRGAKRFTLSAVVGHRSVTFVYDDRAGHVRLRAVSLSSLTIGASAATLRGRAVAGRRRIAFTAVLTRNSLRLRLSNGYARSGRLVRGSVTFVRG